MTELRDRPRLGSNLSPFMRLSCGGVLPDKINYFFFIFLVGFLPRTVRAHFRIASKAGSMLSKNRNLQLFSLLAVMTLNYCVELIAKR